MIVLILSDEEGQQVLRHLLSSPLASVPTGRPSLSLRNVPWSEEERDVIRECSSALEARRAYRAAFPSSDRTDDAIARQFFGCTHPAKDVGQEGPDLSRLDPTLDGLQDEDPAPPREPEPEPPLPAKPKRKPRKDAWTEEEENAIADCTSPGGARAAYRKAHPARCRTDDAIKGRWNLIQKRPRVGKTVRIDLPNSSMHGAVGTVLKIGDGGDCLVSVDDTPASIWIAPERLTVVQQGGSK